MQGSARHWYGDDIWCIDDAWRYGNLPFFFGWTGGRPRYRNQASHLQLSANLLHTALSHPKMPSNLSTSKAHFKLSADLLALSKIIVNPGAWHR